jgi:hypothetical protein
MTRNVRPPAVGRDRGLKGIGGWNAATNTPPRTAMQAPRLAQPAWPHFAGSRPPETAMAAAMRRALTKMGRR